PATVTGTIVMSTLRASPLTLNEPTPWPPSRSTRDKLAMRALAASCAAEVFGAAGPAIVPPADAGGAVRLMQAAPASIAAPARTHAAARSARTAELERPRIAGRVS